MCNRIWYDKSQRASNSVINLVSTCPNHGLNLVLCRRDNFSLFKITDEIQNCTQIQLFTHICVFIFNTYILCSVCLPFIPKPLPWFRFLDLIAFNVVAPNSTGLYFIIQLEWPKAPWQEQKLPAAEWCALYYNRCVLPFKIHVGLGIALRLLLTPLLH